MTAFLWGVELLKVGVLAARLLARYGNRPWGGPEAMTVSVFGPKLREAGVPRSMLQAILMDKRRRFLAFVPKMRRDA